MTWRISNRAWPDPPVSMQALRDDQLEDLVKDALEELKYRHPKKPKKATRNKPDDISGPTQPTACGRIAEKSSQEKIIPSPGSSPGAGQNLQEKNETVS